MPASTGCTSSSSPTASRAGRPNARVYDEAGLIGVVDVLFAPQMLVIEVDGERAHTKRAVFVKDRQKQNRLQLADYKILRYTWWDITGRPDGVVAQIRKAVRQRS